MVKLGGAGAGPAKTIKGEGSSISKKVGWLNKNGWLNASITYTEVIEPLSSIDEASASNLLDELQAKGPSIKDPTKWLISAANRAAESGGVVKKFGGYSGKGGGDKIGKTIGWMNKHSELQQPIHYDEVAPLLLSIGDASAGKLLKQLDEAKETVKNPTAWLASAARRAGASDMMMPMGQMGQMGGFVNMASMGNMASVGSSKKLSKTIGWLNKNTASEKPITFREVIGPLMAMGEGPAGKLLKEFDEKAAEIKDPTKWIIAAAMRKASW